MDRELFLLDTKTYRSPKVDLPTLLSLSTPLHYAIQAMSITLGYTTFEEGYLTS